MPAGHYPPTPANVRKIIDVTLIAQFIDYEGQLPRQAPRRGAKLHFKEHIAKAFYAGYFADKKPTSSEKEFIFNGALFRILEELAYLLSKAFDFQWKHIRYAFDNKDTILRAI